MLNIIILLIIINILLNILLFVLFFINKIKIKELESIIDMGFFVTSQKFKALKEVNNAKNKK